MDDQRLTNNFTNGLRITIIPKKHGSHKIDYSKYNLAAVAAAMMFRFPIFGIIKFRLHC